MNESFKELAIPTNNDTDKQVFDHNVDTSKEVRHPPSEDTDKIFVPNFPPISSEKETAAPTNDTDKQVSRSEASPLTTPISTFRLEKSNPMGLILPQSQKLLLRCLDPTTKIDRGPAFVTSDMDWIDVAAVNPPPFELYTAHDFSRAELVARFTPRGWQGLTGLSSEFEVSCQGDRQKWDLLRKGFNRTYPLKGQLNQVGKEFVWKGSTKTVKSLIGDEKKNKGNLKLTTLDGEVLAVWQQWRDSHVLGDIMIFESARDKIAAEVVLTSCVAVVSAERANGLNWFGGLGK